MLLENGFPIGRQYAGRLGRPGGANDVTQFYDHFEVRPIVPIDD